MFKLLLQAYVESTDRAFHAFLLSGISKSLHATNQYI
jgi:hypothetical protein